jgi:hypothetical protein
MHGKIVTVKQNLDVVCINQCVNDPWLDFLLIIPIRVAADSSGSPVLCRSVDITCLYRKLPIPVAARSKA